ncbi:MAG: YggT family protein [Actinomycetota bacterium]
MLDVVCIALSVYTFILLIRVILSWVQAFGGRIPPALDPVVRVVYDLTEPVLGLFRRYIPPVGMFDLSILVVFIVMAIFRSAIGC